MTPGKEISKSLLDKKILHKKDADVLTKMAAYQNRMVHFYQEISPEELQEICVNHLDEIEALLNKLLDWVRKDTKSKVQSRMLDRSRG